MCLCVSECMHSCVCISSQRPAGSIRLLGAAWCKCFDSSSDPWMEQGFSTSITLQIRVRDSFQHFPLSGNILELYIPLSSSPLLKWDHTEVYRGHSFFPVGVNLCWTPSGRQLLYSGEAIGSFVALLTNSFVVIARQAEIVHLSWDISSSSSFILHNLLLP